MSITNATKLAELVGAGITADGLSGIITAQSFVGRSATIEGGTLVATQFSGNITGTAATFTGNVSIAGTLTYEDVTNVDSIGLITARNGVQVTGGDLLVGTSSSTGTASQRLQVTGGAYVSGNLGVGITNPGAALDVNGTRIFHKSSGINTVEFGYSAGSGDNTAYGLYVPSGRNFYLYGNNTFQLAATSTGVGIGTTNPTSKLHIAGGDSRFGGVIETVSAATTTAIGSTTMVLEMDVRAGTSFTYTMPSGANIGIVSFRNVPAQTGRPSGTTITLIVTQNSAGTANTSAGLGIGTNCSILGYENGANVTGISTRALVATASTVTLSGTASDVDFVSFFIHYNGGSNTTASNYKVYVTNNGNFRRGVVGV